MSRLQRGANRTKVVRQGREARSSVSSPPAVLRQRTARPAPRLLKAESSGVGSGSFSFRWPRLRKVYARASVSASQACVLFAEQEQPSKDSVSALDVGGALASRLSDEGGARIEPVRVGRISTTSCGARARISAQLPKGACFGHLPIARPMKRRRSSISVSIGRWLSVRVCMKGVLLRADRATR